jgi:hypothetical protein
MRIKKGDLVKMRDYDTDLVGIVVDMDPPGGLQTKARPQIGIHWFGATSSKVEWEPESWLEVVSESR